MQTNNTQHDISGTNPRSRFMTSMRRVTWPAVMVYLFPLLLIVPNIGLSITEYNSVWAKLCNIFLPAGVYLLLVSLSRRIGRTILLMIPLMILAAFQIVLLYLYGESIIAIDMYMNVVTTNAGEVSELLGNLKIAIATVLVLYLPPIAIGVLFCVRHRHAPQAALHRARRIGIGTVICGMVLMCVAYAFAPRYNVRREFFPYNVIENLVTAIRRGVESYNYHRTSATFSYHVTPTRDKDLREVYVVVIGETSRADNWEIFGYGRPTNPLLSKRTDLIVFPRTLSEINTTHKSVPMLLSHLNSENFGEEVASSRSIFSAFNDCGYQTAFISNQRRNHSYIDYYGEEARTVEFLTDGGQNVMDAELVNHMNHLIETSPSNKIFIVLHTYGSHFEYRKRYPASMAHFTPEKNTEASRMNRQQLINAYDNTIRYTDMVVDSVIASLDRLDIPAAMVYVSDHGEDLFDDSRNRFLHSSPVPTYWQIHVPFVMWMSDEYSEHFPDIVRNLKANSGYDISSSQNLFHTLIDMTGLRTPYHSESSSLASPQFQEPSRRYLNDYNESVSLEESGLREQDIRELKRNSISLH